MKTIKDIILGRKDPGNLHAWAKTNEDHSIDLGIWYNGKWNFIGGSSEGGGGGAGGDYPSDEQVIHIVAEATYDDIKTTYVTPIVSESETSDVPTYVELLDLINKYKGQVFIDYTVKSKNTPEGDFVNEYRYILRCSYIDEVDESICFTGINRVNNHDVAVSIILDSDDAIWCSPLRVYSGHLLCSVNYTDGYSVAFMYGYEEIEKAIDNEFIVKCAIRDNSTGITHFTTLTERKYITSNEYTYVFSNSLVELTVEYNGTLNSATFRYLRDDIHE